MPGLLRVPLALTLAVGLAQASPWPDLGSPGEAPADAEKDAAVLVGVEDYAFITDVPGAAANIGDWYRDLRARGVPIDRIALLRDAQATREEILAAVVRNAGRVEPGGRLWVVFVGHGAPSPAGEGLLVGADAQQTANSLVARGLPQRELMKAAARAPQAVVVLDACFSGRDPAGEALVAGLQPLIPAQPLAAGATVLLTAAAQDQYAGPLPGGQRPAFSYLALGALRGWGDADGDGVVTAAEVHGYARLVLDSLVTGRRQTPALAARTPGVELARARPGRGPDLDTMRLSFRPTAAVAPAMALPKVGATLRFIAADEGSTFEAAASTTGGVRRCASPVESFTPCVMSGLPIGNARLRITGDLRESQTVPLVDGSTLVEIHESPSWAIWWGGGLMLAGQVTLAISLVNLTDCTGAVQDDSCGSEGAWIAGTALGGASLLAGMSMLSWGLYKWLSIGGETLQIKSVPRASAPIMWGVGATEGGGAITVGGGW